MKKIIAITLFTLSCSQLGQWEGGDLSGGGTSKGHGGSASGGGPIGLWGGRGGDSDADTKGFLSRFGRDPFEKFYQQAQSRIFGQRYNTKESGRPGGLCSRYVDQFLVQMGCMKSRVYSDAAGMKRGLENKGFKNIGSLDVCDAKIGDVIVYGGGGYGHIEIKTPRGYLSDYLVDIPRFYGIPDSAVTNRREFAMGMGRPSKTHCGNGKGTNRPVIGIMRPPAGCI